MSSAQINKSINQLAFEEIHRIYGINNPEQELLSQMCDVISDWPLVKALQH